MSKMDQYSLPLTAYHPHTTQSITHSLGHQHMKENSSWSFLTSKIVVSNITDCIRVTTTKELYNSGLKIMLVADNGSSTEILPLKILNFITVRYPLLPIHPRK